MEAINQKNSEQDNTISELENTINTTKQEVTEMGSRVDVLEHTALTQSETLETIQGDITGIKETNTKQDEEITNLKSKDTELEKKIEEESTSVNGRIDELVQRDTEIENKVNEANSHIENISSEILKIQQKDESQDNFISQLTNSLDTYKQETNNTLQQLKDKDIEQDGKLDTINTSIEGIDSNIESLKTKDKELEKGVKQVNTKLTSLANDVKTQDKKLQDQINTLQEKDIEVDNKLAEIDSNYETVTSEITNLHEKDTEIEGRVKQAEQTVTELDTRVHSELESMQQMVEDQNTMIEAMDTSIDSINNSIKNINSTNTEQDKQLKDLAGRFNENDKKVQDQITQLQQTDIAHTEAIASNTNSITDLTASMTNLNESMTNINQVASRIESEMDILESDISGAKTKNTEQDTKLDELDDGLTQLKATVQQLAGSEDDLDTEIHKTVKEINERLTKEEGNIATNTANITQNTEDITQLKADVQTNTQNIQTNTENIQTNTTDIATNKQDIKTNKESIETLKTDKLDKTFADNVDGKLVSDVKLNETTGTDIVILEQEKLDVKLGTKTSNQLKITSKDNTLVAKVEKDESGAITNIDLSTNLDVDVNYFLSQDKLDTTIGNDNTLQKERLTPITKDNVEVQDIISDEDGTWARVKSIDEEAGTVTATTYAKHANATWGTINGDITNQKDLQDELNKKVNIADIELNSKHLQEAKYSYTPLENKATLELSGKTGIGKEAGSYTNNISISSKDGSVKIDETSTDRNILLNVDSESVGFDSKESGLTSNKLGDTLRELKQLDDKKVQTTTFESFKTEIQNTISSGNESLKQELTDAYEQADSVLDGKITSTSESLQQQIIEEANKKVDKNQGVENSGKYLVVGEDGQVTTKEHHQTETVQSVTSDNNLVDNNDPYNPKILQDVTKLDKSFSDKYLTTFGVEESEDQGVLKVTTKKTEDGSDVESTVDIVGKSGIKITTAYKTDRTNDTITIDATELSTGIEQINTNKLDKQTTANTVYVVDESGEQQNKTFEDIALIKTVNNIQPNEEKNIQLDAKVINVDDSVEEKVSVKDAIEEKLKTETFTQYKTETDKKIQNLTDTKINKTIATETDSKLVGNVVVDSGEKENAICINTKIVSVEDGTLTEVKKYIQSKSNDIQITVDEEGFDITIPKLTELASDTEKLGQLENQLNSLDTELDEYKTETDKKIQENKTNTDTELEKKINKSIFVDKEILTSTITGNKTTLEGNEGIEITSYDTDGVEGALGIYGSKGNIVDITVTTDEGQNSIIIGGNITSSTEIPFTSDGILESDKVEAAINELATLDKAKVKTEDYNTYKKEVEAKFVECNNTKQTLETLQQNLPEDYIPRGEVKGHLLTNLTLTNTEILDVEKTGVGLVTDILDTTTKTVSTSKHRIINTTLTEDELLNCTSASGILIGVIDNNQNGKDIKINVDVETAKFDPKTSKMKSKLVGDAIRELKEETVKIDREINSSSHIQHYTPGETYPNGTFVYIDRDDNITLLGRCKEEVTASETQEQDIDNFKEDVNAGKISLVGIPVEWSEQ